LENYKDFSFVKIIGGILKNPATKVINTLKNSTNNKVKQLIGQFIDLDIKTLGNIYNELVNNIRVFSTDEELEILLDDNKDNITPHDLLDHDIFIQIEEHQLKNWSPILNLMISQQFAFFEMQKEEDIKERTLFMLEEFARLGKIENINTALATLRSKKIRIMMLIQSLSQLDNIYGKDVRKIIVDNCNYKAILKATDGETQEYFSKLIGTHEVLHYSTSSTSSSGGSIIGSSSYTESITTKDEKVIRPETFGYLQNELVLITPNYFYIIDKVKSYEDDKLLEQDCLDGFKAIKGSIRK